MKRKLAVAACVAAGCIATSGTAQAKSQIYTCTFKSGSMVMAMAGPKARAYFCVIFPSYAGSGEGAWHRVSNSIQISTAKQCLWMTPNMKNMVIVSGVPGTPNYLINVLCKMINKSIVNLGFQRMY